MVLASATPLLLLLLAQELPLQWASAHNATGDPWSWTGGAAVSYTRGAARPMYSGRSYDYHQLTRNPPNLPDQLATGLTVLRHGGKSPGSLPHLPRGQGMPPHSVNYDDLDGRQHMGQLPNQPCPPCGRGWILCPLMCECIPEKLRCDNAKDCAMGEDEIDCDGECKGPGTVSCPTTKRCILSHWMCDGVDDCGDNSDEQQCGSPINCTSKEFSCAHGYCVPLTWRCDGDNDCRDSSDELNCTTTPCLENQFACGDLTCIPADDHCNQITDCLDNSDEEGCDVDVVQCDDSEFRCKYPVCVLKEYRCDGDNDCGDWSDEEDCPRRSTCVHGDFQCRSGDCIPARQRCNSERDCEDGEDEADCGPELPAACPPGQHACASGYCIEAGWVCDGVEDCPVGEDEAQCEPPVCNNQTHFACSEEAAAASTPPPGGPPGAGGALSGLVFPHPLDMVLGPGLSCIHRKHVCDGKKDCAAGDDERDCPVPRNCSGGSGCAQLCLEAADGREVCSCRQGYRLAADGRGCEDVDECAGEDDEEPPCQQNCINTNGSFLCSCRPDYVMRPDRRSCKSVEAPATLLLTNRVDIRQVNLNNRLTRTVLRGLHNAVALDFHWRTGEVYWSDYSMHVIRKAALNSSVEQDVVRWGLQTPAGLAVDWVHGLLFWTDYELRRVDVANLDGSMPTTIAHTDLEKPRDVVVHPGRAFVFWTDWGPRPKIERVEMNGQNRRAIITQGIKWPNGLALDYDYDRIFWTDAMYHVIESSDLDGSARSVVLAKGLPHPFALTVFEDSVFWTDWHTRSVMGAHKVTGRRVRVVLDRLHMPMQVHSCHPKRQLAYADRCPRGNDTCSHLCLPSATSFTCVCPVGVRLQSNRRTCEASPESMLVYVRKKEIHLREMSGSAAETGPLAALGLGSSARDVVLAVDGVRHAQAVAWDSASDSIFWSDFKATTISRARRDGSQQRVVVATDLEDPVGLAVDWVRRRLYFSDYKSQRIETTDLEGEERVVLLWNLSGPRHLALFPAGGLMFWSSWGGPKPLIESAGMDGRRRRAFVSDRLISPAGLAIDYDLKRLYWTDPGLGVIDSINVDGTDRRLVMDKMAHPFGLDVFGNRLYWTDSKNNDLYVLKDGKQNHTVRAGVSGLQGVTVFHQRRQPVRTGCDQDNYGCSHVCLLSNTHDVAGCACPVGWRMRAGPDEDGRTCEAQPGPYLLLARRMDIRRVPLGLPYVMDVPLMDATAGVHAGPGPGPGGALQPQNAVAVDADRATGDVYWSDTILMSIMRTARAGGNATAVVSSGLDTPYGLAVDSVGRKLYWTDSGRRIIEVAELDGARRRVLVWDRLHNPCALALHYPAGLMFWSDWEESLGRIERASMDGSARITILSDGVGWPGGLAVHDERLYWSDVMLKTVESARLDGSERAPVLHRLREQPAGVAILGGQLYWGYRGVTGALHRTPLPRNPPANASEASVIRPGLPYLLDIKAIDTSPLPADACAGAGCSDLCLRVPGGHACACPTGVDMSRDGRTCSTNMTDMLLFATPDGLARIATGSLQRFHDVLLPVPDVRKVVAVDFHWEHKVVVFADMAMQEIRSVSMRNWTEVKTLVRLEGGEPTGVAVDWLADNLFWTDAGRRVVGVARLDGRHQKILVSKGLTSPRAVVVHPKKGLMFWTDWGVNGTSEGTKIERAQLDGSERRAIVSTDLGKPNGLALDVQAGRLYWANYERARIESCEITGNDRIQLVAQAQHVFGLTTLGDHIFWTDFSKRTLERAAKRTGRERMTVETMMDQVEDLKAVSSGRQRRVGTPPCGDNNGGCSHLCLAREVDIVCACPDRPHGPCQRSVNRRAPNPSEEDEYSDMDEGLADVSHVSTDLHNATTKTAPVSRVLLVGIPVVIVVLVAAGALAAAYCCRLTRLPRGAAGADKLRPGKAHGRAHAKALGKASQVLTYSNPNYLAERESGAGSSGAGSVSSAGGGSGSGSGGTGGYRGWMRRLKYDRSAERVFDVRDDGHHGGSSPEILSLINSPGSIIAEHSSCVMEGMTPPPTPPPRPRCSRPPPLGGPGPGHGPVHYHHPHLVD